MATWRVCSAAAGVGLPMFCTFFPRRRHDVRGKSAVITGASEGIGVVIANKLAEEGVAKLVLAARQHEKLNKVALELTNKHPNIEVVTVKTDVTKEEDRRNLVQKAGKCEILVNNAGLEIAQYFEKSASTHKHIDQQINVNVLGLMHLTREFLPSMVENRCGHVVNIASMAGQVPLPFMSVYCASKHAIVGFTSSLRLEMRELRTGVTCHVICPAFVSDVGMASNLANEGADYTAATQLFGDSRPEDTANAVVQAIKYDAPELMVNWPPMRPIVVLQKLVPRLPDLIHRVPGLLAPINRFWETQAKTTL